MNSENTFVDECFNGGNFIGENDLVNVSKRYQDSARLQFLLRTAFIPPEDLRTVIQEGYESFLDRVKRRFVTGR